MLTSPVFTSLYIFRLWNHTRGAKLLLTSVYAMVSVGLAVSLVFGSKDTWSAYHLLYSEQAALTDTDVDMTDETHFLPILDTCYLASTPKPMIGIWVAMVRARRTSFFDSAR